MNNTVRCRPFICKESSTCAQGIQKSNILVLVFGNRRSAYRNDMSSVNTTIDKSCMCDQQVTECADEMLEIRTYLYLL